MDIDLLSKMVKELILDRDRVVLPGLGAFVAEIVPSTFSDKGYTINPPYRRLFFRSRPDEGDDLISFYASSNNVELDIADRIIKDFVRELKGVLHEKKTVVFPGLGRLRATKENHVFFVADESLDIYPDGFGLEPISLKTHQETVEEVSAAVVGLRSLLDTPAVKEPAVAPQSAAVPEPAVVPQPAVVPEPAKAQEPAVVPEPAAAPEPVVVPEPVPESALAPTPKPVPEPAPESAPVAGPSSKPFIKAVAWIFAAAAAVLVILAVAGRVCPDLVDPLLYSSEDLEIVRMLES
ncbi:MAG: hypothetical protein IJE11_01635 [Bacteroidales bacterium]|nr:hypothetical protein [Bacteroidales bacterium]